jgi:hypothetical protein
LKASDYYMNYYMRKPKVHVIGLVEAQLALPHPLATRETFDAMNTGHAAVTWLSTVGIGSIRVRRFARGWRPCNGGWDEVGRR